MTLIYILLTIIAIGVLLLSENGKAILGVLSSIVVVGTIGFVAFNVVVGGVAFFQSESFDWFYNHIFPYICLSLFIMFWVYIISSWTLKNYKEVLSNIKKSWIEKRSYSVFVIILLVIIVCSWIVIPVFVSL